MHIHYHLAFVLVLVKVTLCEEVHEEDPQHQLEPRQPRLERRQFNIRNTRLGQMIMTPVEGVRKMAAQTTWGILKTLDPDGSRAGRPRVNRPQRQRGGGQRPRGPQQQRVAITQEEYDYLNNNDYDEFDDGLSFDYYDYSASGETNNDFLRAPVPIAPNQPVRNNNNNRNPGRRPGKRPNGQKIANVPVKQFNRPQIINDLIQRSGLDGPYYPYKTFVG